MIRWSANLTLLFGEVPFLDRFQAARDAGFDGVEFLWPRDAQDDLDALVTSKEAAGVEVALFNIDAGDISAGDRGFAAHPSKKAWWRERAEVAFDLAGRLGATRINALVGNQEPGLPVREMFNCLAQNLAWALPRAQAAGVTLLLEPLNPADNPGYLLDRTSMVVQLIERLASPNLELQLDVYHAERSGEDLLRLVEDHFEHLGHVQIADVPGRNEPGTGQIAWPELLGRLEERGYQGYVGLEYNPSGSTLKSFTWLPGGRGEPCRAADLRL